MDNEKFIIDAQKTLFHVRAYASGEISARAVAQALASDGFTVQVRVWDDGEYRSIPMGQP